ncbi:uncharacterized protein ttc6 isoform X2 [Heterodontus francisci]|uniref:uncharacterized protein ttc6 isoform X2 n=1 Tax=Heterodontus francisci TaxID=7792 RepID=UPI00355B1C1E
MSETQKYLISRDSEEVQELDSLLKKSQPDFLHLRQTWSAAVASAGNPVQEKFNQITTSPVQISEGTQINKISENNVDNNSQAPIGPAKAGPRRNNKRLVVDKGHKASKKILMGGRELHELDGRKQAVFKSAIAAIAGTATGLSMSKRPEPPPKPNSLKLKKTLKSSTLQTPTSVTEKKGKVSAVSKRLHSYNVKTSSKSDGRSNTLSPDATKQSNEKENINKSPSLTEQISSDATGIPLDREGSAHSIHSQGVRSASELLEEAKYLAMPDAPKIYERNFQLSKPEQSLTAAQQTFTAKAKSVDEIIASLRSGSHTTSQSASDQKIKGLLERVFGYSYSSKSEEVTEITTSQKENDVVFPESEGKISVRDSQQIAENQIKKIDHKATESFTEIDRKVRLEEETTRALDSTEIRTVTPPETEQTPKTVAAPTAAQVTPLKQTTVEITDSLQDTLTNKGAEKILALPGEVTYSDIISIKGTAFGLAKEISEDQQILLENDEQPLQRASVLATWTPINKDQGYQTIHHLCTAQPSHVLPIDLQLASKLYYTPSRLGHGSSKLPESIPQKASDTCSDEDFSSLKQQKIARLIYEGIPASEVIRENVQDSVRILPPLSPECLSEWQRIAEYYVERPRMMLFGESMQIHEDATKLFWAPAFPKFAVPISYMQATLFPKLQVELDHVDICDFAMETYQLDEVDDRDEEQENLEEKAALLRTLFKKHKSLPDLREFTFYSSNKSFGNNDFKTMISEPTVHHSERKRRVIILINLNNTVDKPLLVKYASLPNLCFVDESIPKITDRFQTVMKEIELQRQQLIQASLQATIENGHAKKDSEEKTSEVLQFADSQSPSKQSVESTQSLNMTSETVLKRAEKTKHRKKAKAYMRKPLLSRKLAFVFKKLSMPPKALTRSESLPTSIRLKVFAVREPRIKILRRNSSLPSLCNFEVFAKTQGGIPEGVVVREWVRDIWNSWFDEIFPAPEVSSKTVFDKEGSQSALKREPYHLDISRKGIELQNLQPFTEQEETKMYPMLSKSEVTRAALQSEVSKLTYRINVKGESTAFNYCRRGALYRRLGQLKSAMADLNEAIKLETMLLDAYWQRHFLYLLQLKMSDALDDLNFVLKHNKNHADAYTSKGDIYRNKGDITMAIINYSQGLKCRPDGDVYFKRAEMYEQSNDLLVAMEDYFMAFTLNPKRTDAMMKRGLFYFENSTWHLAIQDLTSLIKQEPDNAKARNYRGQAYAKQAMFREAIEDLSAAIHLDPNNWEAFYHRGCLLRKIHPRQALQDFSVSVLINDEVENLNSFLHRGILYTELSEWHAAICDFESVLKLDRSVCLAHINLGLIFLLKMDSYYEAIRRFTNAIKVEPTSTRAYVCRAVAYHKVHNLKSALKDITCAIHLQPQTQYLYLLRGQYLYEMKNLELANFCIQYSAEINKALDSSPIQQATVQTFLKNYDKAIDNLAAMEKTAPLLILLGKTQMKANKHEEALISFRKALDLEVETSEPKVTNDLTQSAEIHYHMGLCYAEQDKLIEAIDSFNNALKVYPNFAKAYYQRGLCRMRLHEVNCVHDFHRALAINPQLFEVYLSRAVYFAMQGRYLKAILSCNEALKLQPQSIRAFLYRGALKFYTKAYRLAVEDLTAAININDTCSLAYFNRAVCYHQANDLQKALKDYGIVLLLGNQKELNLKVLVNRGLLYLSMDDYNNALQDFKAAIVEEPENANIHHAVAICCHNFSQALKLDPFFADAYNGRGNVYMDSGHAAGIKQAQKDFVRALHLNPKCVKARLNLGYNFQVLGRFQKAWDQFTVAIDIDPTFEDAYEGRAVINLQMNNTFGAFQDINSALKISASAKLFTNRGVISQFTGDLPNAMRDYQKAVALDPTYSLAYFNAANLYFYNRQFPQAHDYYTKAIDLQPGDESALLNRAICRVLLRHAKEAMEDFEEAIKLSPYSAHIYFNRANLYATLKQYKDAEKDYSQALQLMPDDALFYKLRADVRGHLGLIEEAVTDYKKAIGIQEAV